MTVKKAREALRMAIDRCCVSRGDMEWTHGYRTAGADSPEQYQNYVRLCEANGKIEAQINHYIASFARAVRKAARAHPVAVRSLRTSKRRTSRRSRGKV